jgi:DNA-binding CsgD family transcriptional regulator
VRSQLKNVLRKTGCHRQAELAALLQSLRTG